MNKRLLSVVLVALMAVALVVGSVMVSAADGITTVDQLEKAGTNGGNYKLGTNVGPSYAGKSDLAGSQIEVGRVGGKAVSLTLDVNGYTIKGVTFIVRPGCTLTLVDGDTVNHASLIADSTFEVTGSKVGDKTNTATLVISSGTIDNSTINAKEYSNVTVAGGTITNDANAIIVNGTDAVANVTGGTITAPTAIWVQNGKVTVNGGTLTSTEGTGANLVQVENGTFTLTTGTVNASKATGKALYVVGGKAYLNGGTLTGKTVMTGSADVRVNGATIVGDISKEGGNGDLDVLSGDVQGTIDVDDANILGGSFTKMPKVDEDVVAVIYVEDSAINAKGDAVEVWKRYVVGSDLINATLKKLDSFKFKDDQYNDTFEVIVDKKAIDAEVVNGGVYGTYETKDTPHNTKINGYVLGSTLQAGTAYDKAITSGQPMHKWGELVKATEHDCTKETVLVDYRPDTLNAHQYVTYDKDGKEVVNADVKVTLKDYNGNVILDNAGKEKIFSNGIEPVVGAGHPYGALKAVPFKAPTATEAGNYQYWECQCCGAKLATFVTNANQQGRLPIEDAVEFDPTIPALGTGTTTTPTDPTPTDPDKKPDEGGSDITTDPGKTGDVDNFAWVVCLAVSAIGAVAVAGSMVASKKYDR